MDLRVTVFRQVEMATSSSTASQPNLLPVSATSSVLPTARPFTPCPHCGASFLRLASHVRYCKSRAVKHPQAPYQSVVPVDPVSSSLLITLSNFKVTRVVAKWIPAGARQTAADSLIKIIRDCLQNNHNSGWSRLLCFAYEGLHIPDPSAKREKSLTKYMKSNLEKAANGASDIRKQPERRRKPAKLSDDFRLRKAVEGKIQEGNISGAVRLLSSDDSVVPCSPETLVVMKEKHPATPEGMCGIAVLEPPVVSLNQAVLAPVSSEEVLRAVFSFPNGSAGGLDGMKPQHLKDILGRRDDPDSTACAVLKNLMDYVIGGNVPAEYCPVFYGANLIALKKKTGGMRPIAVGNALRRTAGKIVASRVQEDMGNYLRPVQLGFGTKSGAEAVVHGARNFVTSEPPKTKVLFKIDYVNAFNSLDRLAMLAAVERHLPQYQNFIRQAYSSPSCLLFDKEEILSQRGAQQGDPLGPLLFCLAIHPIASALKSEFSVFYLDDGCFGGDPHIALQDFRILKERSAEIGLQLNLKKCEIFVFGGTMEERKNILSEVLRYEPDLKVLAEEEMILLGAPLFDIGIPPAIDAHVKALTRMCDRFGIIGAHQAFYLLRHCFALPKLLYTLRCSLCWKFEAQLRVFDELVRSTITRITNVDMIEAAWIESCLPIKRGGLGVRRAELLSLLAFLASVNSAKSIVAVISGGTSLEILEEQAKACWFLKVNSAFPSEVGSRFQKSWDEPMIMRIEEQITSTTENDVKSKARILAIRETDAGQWLNALPTSCHGNLLSDQEFRIAVKLRLGARVVEIHDCVGCGKKVEENGHHGLSCKRSAGRIARHSSLNEYVRRKFVSAGVDAVLEPGGLDPRSSLRPDGKTRVMWKDGKAAIWDITVADTMADTFIQMTSQVRGAAAEEKERRKNTKYHCLTDRFVFYPLALETFGVWGEAALSLFADIGKKLRLKTGDPRSFSFLIQGLSILLQRGNAHCVMGTLPTDM